MATGTTTSSGSISTITGQCVMARARAGLNGGSVSTDEVTVGRDASDADGTQKIWDTNLSDGLDSLWVPVELICEKDGGSNAVKWAVDAAAVEPVTYSGVSYGTIGRVRIRAGVRIGAAARWRSVSVKWYKDGRVVESFSQSAGPEVDTQASPAEAEQMLEVVPVGTTHQRVVVKGEVRLVCPEGTVPEEDDLLAEVFVDCASCTSL